MGNPDVIVDLVLAHFQHVLHDISADADAFKYKYAKYAHGTPPSSLVVDQREPAPHAFLRLGITIRRWRVTQTTISPLDLAEALAPPVADGMYYQYGLAYFAVFQGGTTVFAGWQVGPRYGRGYDLPVVQENGIPTGFGALEMKWVS